MGGGWEGFLLLMSSVVRFPWQAGGGVPEGYGGAGTLQSSSPKMAHIARVATIANSAAMAFLARWVGPAVGCGGAHVFAALYAISMGHKEVKEERCMLRPIDLCMKEVSQLTFKAQINV